MGVSPMRPMTGILYPNQTCPRPDGRGRSLSRSPRRGATDMARRASDRDPALDNPNPAPEPAAAEPATASTAEKEAGHPGEYVRVRHPQTGDHFTTTRALARRMGA